MSSTISHQDISRLFANFEPSVAAQVGKANQEKLRQVTGRIISEAIDENVSECEAGVGFVRRVTPKRDGVLEIFLTIPALCTLHGEKNNEERVVFLTHEKDSLSSVCFYVRYRLLSGEDVSFVWPHAVQESA